MEKRKQERERERDHPGLSLPRGVAWFQNLQIRETVGKEGEGYEAGEGREGKGKQRERKEEGERERDIKKRMVGKGKEAILSPQRIDLAPLLLNVRGERERRGNRERRGEIKHYGKSERMRGEETGKKSKDEMNRPEILNEEIKGR